MRDVIFERLLIQFYRMVVHKMTSHYQKGEMSLVATILFFVTFTMQKNRTILKILHDIMIKVFPLSLLTSINEKVDAFSSTHRLYFSRC
jgi:hypothetical protein